MSTLFLLDHDLPPDYAATLADLHRVATHVLARARAAQGGRFGLRSDHGGIATPPFGSQDTVLRLAGTLLIKEDQGTSGRSSAVLDLTGSSLGGAARFVGVDLDEAFEPGGDAPESGDPDRPLTVGAEAAAIALHWYPFGATVIDTVLAELDEPSAPQLWPEHFDLAVTASTQTGGVNLGVCAGDAGHPTPYLYVGPWGAERPGDPSYWNASFGAVMSRHLLGAAEDPLAAATAFYRRGLDLLAQ